jgi:hypothetical protein
MHYFYGLRLSGSFRAITIVVLGMLLMTGSLFSGTERERRQSDLRSSVVKPSEMKSLLTDPQRSRPEKLIELMSSPEVTNRLQKTANVEVYSLYQEWENDAWHDRERELLYGTQGRIEESVNQVMEEGDWVNVDRFVLVYPDGGFLYSEVIWQLWVDGDWENYDRDLISYNEQSRESTIITEDWEDGDWVPSYRLDFFYTASGRYDQLIEYAWFNGDWELQDRIRWEYDSNDNTTALYYEYYDGEEFHADARTVYTYDDNNNMLTSSTEVWDEEEEEWFTFFHSIYAYNDLGQRTYSISGNSLTGELVFTTRTDFSYNAQGLVEREIRSVAEGEDWVPNRRISYAYDSSGNRVVVLSENAVGESWVNHYRYLYGNAVPTSVTDDVRLPVRYELLQNYPNPFNPSTNIRFSVAERERVQLTVYNTLGQLVATLLNDELNPGVHDVVFNATGLPSGVYYYRLQAGTFSETKKFMLLR